MNRSSKLAVVLGIAGFCLCFAGQAIAQDQWHLGMQAYSFNRFTFYEAVEKNQTLGMDVIEAYPGQKLSPQHGDARFDHNMSPALMLEVMAPERMVAGKTDHLDARIEQVSRYQALLPRGESIDGIIHHSLKFCDVFGTDRSQFKARVQENLDIPVLDIERDYSPSSSGQISTRVEAFSEVLAGK